ncbi:collagen-like protein [Dyella psychrodurans]|uniref:collagen-like protein n=1 Tax=Dyella psychrodurans TaxID=1927960 RepID=UPI0011C0204D|nr:collagen-like protein [Dyella psychrodurans]
MSILQLAKALNLDLDRIRRGDVIETKVVAKSPEHFKELFGAINGISQEHRPYARHHLAESCCRDCYQAGLHHFSDFLTGGVHALDTEIGKTFFDKRFPMEVAVTVGSDITLTSDAIFPAGTAPVFIACENLTFNGGSYVLQNTQFTLWVTEQLKIVKGGTRPYHIGILGAPGSAGSAGSPGDSQNPAPNGPDAPTPTPGICTGAGSGGNGVNGQPGNKGHDGKEGQDGLPSILSSINVASFASPQAPLVIFGQSGQGGDGGAGGAGGQGQKGGNGGNGCSSGCEGTDGGNGGNGGDGGLGGNGGQGGNSPNGGQLFVNLPSNQQGANFFVYQGAMAKPGKGGALGPAGARGDGGTAGSGGHGSRDGSKGNNGAAGNNGAKGTDGSQFGAPPQLIPGTYAPPAA